MTGVGFKHLLSAVEKRVDRQRYITELCRSLEEMLGAAGITAEVYGRPKHIYSIHRKMDRKQLSFEQVFDLRAVRIVTATVADCYAALGLVHGRYTYIPGEFDDYIATPKDNFYRSIHTAVLGPEGKAVEVQIRTREMHDQAELGLAAHWRYKESRAHDVSYDRKIEWVRQLLDTSRRGGDRDFLDEVRAELFEDRVYALTPKGEVVDLPHGATPLDFAYYVHTEVGHRCRGAKVNGRIVPLEHKLATGDRVEILTAKTGEPKRDWLVVANGFLASPRSREKVRNWFNRLDRARNVQAGRELLEKELKRVGLQHVDPAPALAKFNATTLEDLQVLVALGDVGAHQVARVLAEHERARAEPREAETAPQVRVPQRGASSPAPGFTVVGIGNLLAQPARCCQPLPGEPVVGYLTRGRGVSVHRQDCATFLRLSAGQPARVLPVEWGRRGSGAESDVVIDAVDRKWLLKDVSNLIAQEDAHVLAIQSEARKGGQVRLRLRLRVADFGQLSRLLARLDGLPGVEQSRRA